MKAYEYPEVREHLRTHHGIDDASSLASEVSDLAGALELHHEDHTINSRGGWWEGSTRPDVIGHRHHRLPEAP